MNNKTKAAPMTREVISNEQNRIVKEIDILKAQWLDLKHESLLLCDDEQWYTETEEEYIVSKRPKVTEKQIVGRRHWVEGFKDEDTGETIMIERSEPVRINGEWIYFS